jgi:hypothetical protein
MITPSVFKKILTITAVVILYAGSYAQAENYEWLKSPNYETIFVYTDLNGCDFIADKLNETVKRTFSRSNITATISNSMAFQTTGENETAVYELLDEKLISADKIILHIYGKCMKYGSGFIYQFDLHFGVNNNEYSQALLYSTPRHSVMGVDTVMSIERTFRALMEKVVNDYLSSNQQ